MNLRQSLSTSYLWLAALGAGLAAVQLSIAEKSHNSDLWGISLLCWSASGFLFWRGRLRLKPSIDSSIDYGAWLFGAFIIVVTLLKSLSFNHTFPYLSPLLSAVGVALLASGWQGFKVHRDELIILGSIALLNFPVILFFDRFDTSLLTAKTAAVILWYLGLNASHQGQDLRLEHSGVSVYPGCSGMESILQLLNLGIVFCVMFLPRWSLWGFVEGVAIAIGFFVNACRVALMAYLSAYSTKEAFEYWHRGTGSLIFSALAVFLLGLFCWVVLKLDDTLSDQQASIVADEE
jgi:cyanoexosortase A